MVDFNSLRNKAQDFVEKHEDQIDKGIDKAADAAGKKFGHRDQIDKAADKLQDLTDDGTPDRATPDRGTRGRDTPDNHVGRHHRPE